MTEGGAHIDTEVKRKRELDSGKGGREGKGKR